MRIRFLLGVLIYWACSCTVLFAEELTPMPVQLKVKNPPKSCKQISLFCVVCQDGKLYEPGTKKKILLTDQNPYACVVKGKMKNNKNKCVAVSKFCDVCPDGSYEFQKTHQKIQSDLYECATKSRLQSVRSHK